MRLFVDGTDSLVKGFALPLAAAGCHWLPSAADHRFWVFGLRVEWVYFHSSHREEKVARRARSAGASMRRQARGAGRPTRCRWRL